jgi:hypothetical protein
MSISPCYTGHWMFRSIVPISDIETFLSSLPANPSLASSVNQPLVGINKNHNPYSLIEPVSIFSPFVTNSSILSIIKSISGSRILRPIQVGLLTKIPGSPATPWHRDKDHLPVSTNVYTAWIPLTPIPPSLSLIYAEGTAITDPFKTQVSSFNSLSQILNDHGSPISDPIALNPGDIDIHDGRVWHYGPSNTSQSTRHAVAIAYVPDGARIQLSPPGFDAFAGLPMRLSILSSNFPGLLDGDLIGSEHHMAL